jgi:hypothetical protein
MVNSFLQATALTNALITAPHPLPSATIKVKVRFLIRPETATNSVQMFVAAGAFNQGMGAYYGNINGVCVGAASSVPSYFVVGPLSDAAYHGKFIRCDFTRTNALGRIDFGGCEWAKLNELELAAYNAGWRP